MADLGVKDSGDVDVDIDVGLGFKPDQPSEEMHAHPTAPAHFPTAEQLKEWMGDYRCKVDECKEATSNNTHLQKQLLQLSEAFTTVRGCVEAVRDALPPLPSGAVRTLASLPGTVEFMQSATTKAWAKVDEVEQERDDIAEKLGAAQAANFMAPHEIKRLTEKAFNEHLCLQIALQEVAALKGRVHDLQAERVAFLAQQLEFKLRIATFEAAAAVP